MKEQESSSEKGESEREEKKEVFTEHENMLTSFQKEEEKLSEEFSPSKQPVAYKPICHGIGGDKEEGQDTAGDAGLHKKKRTECKSPNRPPWKTCFPSPQPIITPLIESKPRARTLTSTTEIVRKLSKSIELMLDMMDEDEITQNLRKLLQAPLSKLNKLSLHIQKGENRGKELKMELDHTREDNRKTKIVNLALNKQLKSIEMSNQGMTKEISESTNKLNKMKIDYERVHMKVLGDTNTKISTYKQKKESVEGKLENREIIEKNLQSKRRDADGELKRCRKSLALVCAEERNIRAQLGEKNEKELKLLGMIDKRTVKTINNPPVNKPTTTIHNIPK